MIRSRLLVTTSCLVFAVGFAACGGSTPPPEEPPAAEPVAAAPAPEPEPAPPAEAPPEAPKEEPPPPRKAAKDVLLSPGWDFVLSFADSDIKGKAQEACEKKAKEDEKKLQDCMTKAEADAANDRIKFAQDDKGNWWFISMGKPPKGKEVIYNKIQFKIAKEETDKLVLTPEGKDGGKKAIKKLPAELVVEMPDEYSVVVHHPDNGKLVYKVKVTGDSGPKPVEETPAEGPKPVEKKSP